MQEATCAALYPRIGIHHHKHIRYNLEIKHRKHYRTERGVEIGSVEKHTGNSDGIILVVIVLHPENKMSVVLL
jgi:hypothetical protein